MKQILFCSVFLLLYSFIFSQNELKESNNNNLVGLVVNPQMIGVQFEKKIYNSIGARLGLVNIMLTDNEKSTMYSGLGMLTYHIKTDNIKLDPLIGAGVGYIIHNWYWEAFETNGLYG